MTRFYVDPLNGDNANDGLNPIVIGGGVGPWKTTQKSADTAVADDEVRLMNTAVEIITAVLDFDTNTGRIEWIGADSNGDPLTGSSKYIIRAGAVIATVMRHYAAVDNLHFTRIDFDGNDQATNVLLATEVGSAGHILNFCRFQRATSHGLQGRGGHTLTACEIDNNGGGGVFHHSINGWAIRLNYCIIHDNVGDGWNVRANSGQINNSLVYNNGGSGVFFDQTSSAGTTINACIMFNNAVDGVRSRAGAGGQLVTNTSCVNNGGYGFNFAGQVSDFRIFLHNHTDGNALGASDVGMPGEGHQTGNPLFANITAGTEDFTPTTGSPLLLNGLIGSDIGVIGLSACLEPAVESSSSSLSSSAAAATPSESSSISSEVPLPSVSSSSSSIGPVSPIFPAGTTPDDRRQVPSSVCSIGMRPQFMTGALEQLLFDHFCDFANIENPMLRQKLETLRPVQILDETGETPPGGMLITSATKWQPQTAGQRPAIILRRNDWQWERQIIDDRIMGDRTPDQFERYIGWWRGSHTLFAIGRSGAEAEILGSEVAKIMVWYHDQIREAFNLTRFRLVGVGALVEIEEEAEHYAVPVTVAYRGEEAWTMHQNVPRLKSIKVSLAGVLRC